jgi:glutamate N-acetyltransferase/amino-acid N-acetyltransferase
VEGLRTAEAATERAARLLGVPPRAVLPCATGRIGVAVPRARLLAGVDAAARALSRDGFAAAAEAITTTDAFPKTAVRRLRLGGREVTLAALGKGAGMIAPRMATLLVFVVTDARLTPSVARRALADVAAVTLNAISVDGDMSTNDTALLLAGGAAGNGTLTLGSRAYARFTHALGEVLGEIGRLIVLDGEGSTRLIGVTVRGARTAAEAARVARAVATSTLCKAAFHGADPNWGRFVCAAGTAGVAIDAARVDVTIGGIAVSRRGRPVAGALGRAARRMRGREVEIVLDLRSGRGSARILTSDLSPQYLHFNAAYTS